MRNNIVTIQGVVGAVDWDAAGKVSMVSILTKTDEEYLVVDNEEGNELLAREGEEVKATGIVSESESDEISLIVYTYEALDDDLVGEDDEEDDSQDDDDDGPDDEDNEEDYDYKDYDYEDYNKGYKY